MPVPSVYALKRSDEGSIVTGLLLLLGVAGVVASRRVEFFAVQIEIDTASFS